MVHVDHFLTSHPLAVLAVTIVFEQAGIPIASAPMLLLIGALISGLVYLIGSLILHLDTTWVNAASTLCTGMMIASCVLLIWNGFVRKKGSPQ